MNGNPLLGHWKCERGGNAEVFQTKKRGSHFYTRCDCCGLNQGTGAGRQQDIYDKAVFLAGVTVAKPSNVGDAPGEKVIEHEPAKLESGTQGDSDFDPKEIPADEPVKKPEDKKSGFARFVPGVVLLAAAGVGLWMS